MTEDAAFALVKSALEGLRAEIVMLRTELSTVRREMSAELEAVRVDGSDRGRRVWERFEEQARILGAMDLRLARVEGGLDAAAPTLKEYQALRARAESAGWIGRKLWVTGGLIISAAAWVYSSWERIIDVIRWLGHR